MIKADGALDRWMKAFHRRVEARAVLRVRRAPGRQADGLEWHRQVGALRGRVRKLLEQLEADEQVATRPEVGLSAPEREALAAFMDDAGTNLSRVATALRNFGSGRGAGLRQPRKQERASGGGGWSWRPE